ncbi:MAG: hypothetical protein AAFQ41_04210 [Cyanobacteria bacterium J06623_7]
MLANLNSELPAKDIGFSAILLLITFAFASIHIWSHHLHKSLRRYQLFVTSFSAGLAITYVFLHLFPSLEAAEATVGSQIHIITLLGFVIFYGIKTLVAQNSTTAEAEADRAFYIEITFLAIYNALIIITLPEHLGIITLEVLLYLLAMGLHLLALNYRLQENHQRQLYRKGCIILAISLLLGFLVDVAIDPLVSKAISDMLTAILAGFVLFNTFVEELPHPKTSTFIWFVGGIISYVFLLEL